MSFQSDIASQPLKLDNIEHQSIGNKRKQYLYEATISSRWGINNVPNGGYLMGVIANAAEQGAEKKVLMHISCNFLKRTDPQNAVIHVQQLAISRQYERLQIDLLQNERHCIHGMLMFKDHYNSDDKRYLQASPNVPPRYKCLRMQGLAGYSIFSNVEMYLDHPSTAYLRGARNQQAIHQGWIKNPSDEPWSAAALCLAADAFPPPIMSHSGLSPWVPTLEMSIQIRQLPQSKWLKCRFQTRFISAELIEEDGELWDEKGNLIAISRQLAAYRHTEQSPRRSAAIKGFYFYMKLKKWLSRKNH